MALPRPASPKALWRDLRSFASGEHRHKLLFALLAILMPAIIVFGFIKDARTNIMPGASVIYVQGWSADRTDAEIIAQQKIDEARRQQAIKERQAAYKRLQDKLGIE